MTAPNPFDGPEPPGNSSPSLAAPGLPPAEPPIFLFILTRVVINASYRMIYPFLNFFAAGLQVSLATVALPLTVRSLVGAAGPLLAPIGDRYGRKVGMLFGLGLYGLGISLVAIWPVFPAFFAGIVLSHLGNMIFLPAMQAYLGDRVPYSRRGRALALTELSWSLSFIVIVPLAGLMIARLGWVTPFIGLAGLGWLAFALVAWRVPADQPQASRPAFGALWAGLGQLLRSPRARLALTFSLLITVANEVVNLVFGVWMNDSFHLQIAALGLAATLIGIAELSGETATAVFVDRIGKARAVRIGLVFTSLAALALPLLGGTLPGALFGLFCFYLGFEFTLVSYLPLMTEVFPQARATLIAANLASFSLGRALGALAGGWLYAGQGFWANALAALLLNGLALLAISRLHVEE